MTRTLSSLSRAALAVLVPAWLLAVPVSAQRGETRGSSPAPSAPAASTPPASAPAPSGGGTSSGSSGSTSSGGGGSASSGGGARSSGDSGGRNHAGNGASGSAIQRGGDRGGDRSSGATRANGGATNSGARTGNGASSTGTNAGAGNGAAPATGRAVPRGDGTSTGRKDTAPDPERRTGVPAYARPRDGAPVVGTAVPRTAAPPTPGSGVALVPGYYGSYGYYSGYYQPWWYGVGALGGYGYFSGYDDPWYGGTPPPPSSVGSFRDEGALRLKIKPREAEVYVDGYYVGIVDDFDGIFQRLHIETGAHRVEVRAPGYEPLVFDVRISPDHSTTYQGELQKIQ